MELWSTPYLLPYLLLFLFWMLAIHRQILFWLYLWQLKEYHLGRFLAHFETAKGESVFISPLFIAKIGLILAGPAFYVWFALSHSLPLGSLALLTARVPFAAATFWFSAAVFIINFIEAARGVSALLKGMLLYPVITKKSLMLIIANHALLFSVAILIFNALLGEMRLVDLAIAAFLLLLVDIFLAIIVALTVFALQPITTWQKNRILAKAAVLIKERPDLTVIGITGSYGKSVTKELLSSILASKYPVLKTEANQNTEIGVAQAILAKLKPEHKFFVCEIGAVHKGRIKQVASAIKPKIGILTGINQQHLGIFGGQQNIVDAKYELLESLAENATAILNFNSALVRDGYDIKKEKIKAKNAIIIGKDIAASGIKPDAKGLIFDINYRGEKAAVIANARGAFMVEPMLLAIAGALTAGMDLSEVARILNQTNFNPYNLARISAGVIPLQKMPEELLFLNRLIRQTPMALSRIWII